MKKLLGVAAAAALVVGPLAGTAAAHDHGGPPPRHGHVLVLGLQLDEAGEPVGFRKCVDLAGGNWLPLTAHHMRVHTGNAGQALFNHAGHMVVPTAPLTPFANCAELIEMLEAGEL